MKKKGFTLVELSIVLVIIGLLIGGVLVGQSLIDSAKVNSVTSEFLQYEAAARLFRTKYKHLPGDNTLFAHDGDNAAGNGIISYPGTGQQGEWLRAWQHLSLGGMVEGNYTGLKNGTTPVLDENTVRSKAFKNAGYSFFKYNSVGYYNGSQTIMFGEPRPSSSTTNSAISTAIATAIDQKLDDGVADTGIVRPHPEAALSPGCFTNTVGGSTYSAADYNISSSTGLCNLMYYTSF